MIFLGNYRDWVKQEYIDYILNNNGVERPKTSKENPDTEEFRRAKEVGYDLSSIMWRHYEDIVTPLDIKPPFDIGNKKIMWWFIKLLPGNYMPMHRDPHVTWEDRKNVERFWMPMQDYEPGHIFIYKDSMLSNYKCGDLYRYDDENAIHGAANIGYTPRITFMFSTYDLHT